MAPIDDIARIITDAIIRALKDREGELRAVAEAGGSKAHSDFTGDVGDLAAVFDLLLNVFAVANPEFAIPVAIKDAADAAGGRLGRGFAVGYFLGYQLFSMAQPYLNFITHAIANGAQSELWPPDQIAEYVAKGLINAATARTEAGGSGFDTVHTDVMIEAALAHPDVPTLMTLRNLDKITDEQVVTALKRHGMDEQWLEPLQALRRYLLSPADLALANLRGAIGDDVLSSYGAQLGITPADMDVLIANTGEPPGPEQLMEALRRGFIQQDRFERGIRQSRVRNEWIDVETALRHSPMTTADALRAVVENHLQEEEGRAIAEQNGLIPEHWTPLLESWGRPLSHEQMLTLFHRDQATLEEVRQAFRESDLKNKYADKAIELGRRLIPERTIVSAIDHGVLAHDEGVTMLRHLGFDQHDADVLVKLGVAQRTSSHKTLTRSDILQMHTDGLLGRQDAEKHLVTLGYTQPDATAMLDLAETKVKLAQLRTAQRGIEASLKAHHLTPEQAKTELVKVGTDATLAGRLVDEWTQQRGAVVHTLSSAEIASAAYYGMITFEQAVTGIMNLGWTENDAKILVGIRLKGLPTGVTVTPPTATKQ